MPEPVIVKVTMPLVESTVIVNGAAPLSKIILSTCTAVVLMERFVTVDVPKVATSPGPFGTVFGIQFVGVFQLPFKGFEPQVALPANAGRWIARNSSANQMIEASRLIRIFIGEH